MKRTSLFALASLLLACHFGGTISETNTRCALDGFVRYQNGNAVCDADVSLHHQFLTTERTLKKTAALLASQSIKTDSNGYFRFDSVATGTVLVEFNDHDTLGAVLAAHITEEDTLVQVESIVKKYGTIVGKIDTGSFQKTGNAVLILPEINRKVPVDSLGGFVIEKLPEWNYQVRFAIGDSIHPLPSDTIRIPVSAGDTTRIISLGAKAGSVIIDGKIVETPNP